jgi:hypothetical protein
MTNGLDRWLKQATRRLSNDSTLQVTTEIREHYESAREAALESGATADQAEEVASTALGDAKRANRQYRKVLLTSAEARLLGRHLGITGYLLAAAREGAPPLRAGDRATSSRSAISHRIGRSSAGTASWRYGNESIVHSAVPAGLYASAQSHCPLCEMGCAGWHAGTGFRGGHSHVLLAGDRFLMARGLGEWTRISISSQIARGAVAQHLYL